MIYSLSLPGILCMKLNLDSLEKAIARLKEALEFSHSEMSQQNQRLFQQFRNSVIQCFEFTYEISFKMIEKKLKSELPTPIENSKIGFNDLIRDAAQYGLIDDPKSWMEYRRARNVTSHTYNDVLAQEVYDVAINFLNSAEKLLLKLKERNQ